MPSRPLFLFAHGAGAGSAHPWMQGWRERLERIGAVQTFDYPYMQKGRRSPDRFPKLLEAHRVVLQQARSTHNGPIFLIGKSMGSRVGCHLALEEMVHGVICLGYPLVGLSKNATVRDQVLLELERPILFLQGSRDRLCPLDKLAEVRPRMRAANTLHVVEAGDHSLRVTRTYTKETGITQDTSDHAVLEAIRSFVDELDRPSRDPSVNP